MRGSPSVLSLMFVVSCDPAIVQLFQQGGSSAPAPDAAPASDAAPAPAPDGGSASSPTPSVLPAHARCGYIGYGDDIGYDGFAANAAFFDVIHPDWYRLAADGVSLTPQRGVNDSRVLQAAHANGVAIIPLIAAVDDPTPTETMLSSPTLRTEHVQALTSLAVAQGYAGLELDYEHLPTSYRDSFTALMTELATAMHAHGLEVSVAAYAQEAELSVYDYPGLANVIDHIHVMGYDFHWSGTHAGPLAPLGWVQAAAQHAAASGKPEKFILALPNYAYTPTSYCRLADCPTACSGAIAVTTTEMQTCSLNIYDHFIAGREPNCMTTGGIQYFDDTASLAEKVQAARSAGLGGIGYWTVGAEPSGFFAMIRQYYP